MKYSRDVKILAVASAGGHWVQLRRLSRMFEKFDVSYCCTDQRALGKFFKVSDISADSIFKLPLVMIQALVICIRVRPDVVITTGALPGLIVAIIAKYLFKSKFIWIDSIANGGDISKSGRYAKSHADLCLTQWSDLADSDFSYMGSVI